MDSLGRCSSSKRCFARGRHVHRWKVIVAAVVATVVVLVLVLADVFLLARTSNDVRLSAAGFLFSLPGSSEHTACSPSEDESGEAANNLLPHDGNVYSVPRAAGGSVQARMRVSIPQTIWQTARSHNDTPPLGIDLFNSWTRCNKAYDHFFLDDAEVQEFVEAHYNQSVAEAFKNMPLGVMRADAVRYMMVYHYGGVYADMDTQCLQPIESWAPSGCHFAVALENEHHFCQWAFAAVPGHGALASVLDLVIRRILATDFSTAPAVDEHFVHAVTGPGAFTEGLLRWLQVDWTSGQLDALHEAEAAGLRERGVCLLSAAELKESLVNLYGSQREDLQSKSWKSWTEARDQFLDAKGGAGEGGDTPDEPPGDGDGQGDAPDAPDVRDS